MNEPQIVFQGIRFRVERTTQTGADGAEHVRDIVRHPGSVAIVPLLADGRVCLIENYRVAAGQKLLELPAGTLEPGEDPLACARRELAEETGYRAGQIRPLATFYLSPGILDERMSLYLATSLEPGPMALEAGEDILTRSTPWAEALAMVVDGRIQDAKTMLGLLFWRQFAM